MSMEAVFLQSLLHFALFLGAIAMAVFLSLQQRAGRIALRQLCTWVLENIPHEQLDNEPLPQDEVLYETASSSDEEDEPSEGELDGILDAVYESDSALNQMIAEEIKRS